MDYPDDWICPICNTHISNSEKCTNCTYPKLWHCKKCKKELHNTLICDNCGYNSLNPKKSKTVIKKGDIILVLLVIYLIIMGGVITAILLQDKFNTSGELLLGDSISISFWTFQKPLSVNVIIDAPSSNSITLPMTLNTTSNNWILNGLVLNESGRWSIIVEKNYEDSSSTYESVIKVNSQCTLDEHCSYLGDDYACNTQMGECIQKKPGIFDFLDVIMG